jgi:glycosyltransferase involved in cell wall biosynthesis
MSPTRVRARRPRVLMLIGAYFPEVSGGGLQCRTLVRALRDYADFTVLTTTRDARLAGLHTVDGVPVHRIHVDPARPVTKLRAFLAFLTTGRRLLRATDVLHFHGLSEKMLLLVPLARAAGVRVLSKMTSVGLDDPASLRGVRGRLLRRALDAAHLHVALSPAMHERFVATGSDPSRLRFIPNGVDTTRFFPASDEERATARAAHGLPPGGSVVVQVGFWSRDKGPDVLLDAWLRARATLPAPATLLFIGAAGPGHVEVDAALVADARARIRAAGAETAVHLVDHAGDVAGYLRAADVFVLASRREGLPNALLEAMATGLPCIASDLPGVTSWLVRTGETGVLIPVGGVDALETALRALFHDPARARALGAAARRAVVERCGIDTVAAQYLEVYRALLPSDGA